MTHNTPTKQMLAVLTGIADGEITKPAEVDGEITLAQLRAAGLVTKRGLKLTKVGNDVVATAKVQHRSQFKPEALAEVLDTIKVMRADNKGWATIAKFFNENGIPAAKGGQWAPAQVRAVGMRAGMPTRLG